MLFGYTRNAFSRYLSLSAFEAVLIIMFLLCGNEIEEDINQ